MKLDFLLDTNILILLFNDSLAKSIPDAQLEYSTITAIKLLSFSRLTKDEEVLISKNLQTGLQIELKTEVAEKTILLRQKYSLKTPDAIIAATA